MVTANFTAYGTYTTDSLYQWDKDQTLTVTGIDTDSAVPEVHFTNIDMGRAVVRQASLSGDAIICEIPNGVLQYPYDVKAYIGVRDGDTFTTLETVIIPIIERNKPEDYTLDVDTDEDYYSFNKLTNQYANAATKQEVANIIAHNQDTSSNTELIDIRTGADGAKYATAGQAVREQISGLASDLINGSRAYRPLLNGTYSAGGAFVPSTTTISTSLIQFVAGATISINAGTFHYNVCMWRDTVSAATKTRYDSTALSGSETITPDYDGYIAITFFMTGSSKAITVDDFDGSVVVTNGMISTMQTNIAALQTATAKHVYEINLFYEKTEDELDRITACTFLGFKVLEDGTDITSNISNFKSFIEEKLEQNTSYNLHNVIKMYSVQNSSSTVTNSNHRELIVAYNNYTTQLTRFYCLNTDVKGFVFFKSSEITASFEPSDDEELKQLTEKYYGTLVNITLDLTDLAPDLTNIDLVDANHFEDYLTITYTEYKLNASTTEYASVVTYNVTGYGLTRFINNRLPQMITKGKVDIIVEFSRHTGDDTYESIICRGEHITNANGGIYSNLLKLTPILINAFVNKYLADENKYAGVILVPNYEHMASYNTEIRYKSLVDDELTEGSTNLVTSGTLFDIVGNTELPSIGDGTIKDTINSLYNLIGVDEKTASGEVVTLSDAAAVPFNSLKVGIEAVQDLHGYDKPWAGGAGKNLLDASLIRQGDLNDSVDIRVTYDNGFELTVGQTYTAWCDNPSDLCWSVFVWNPSTKQILELFANMTAYAPVTFAPTVAGCFGIVFGRNTDTDINAVECVEMKPMCEKGSAPTSYEPYSNICPISGWDAVNVTRCGKNLFDKTATDTTKGFISGKWINQTGNTFNYGGWSVSEYIRVDGEKIAISGMTIDTQVSSGRGGYCCYDKSFNVLGGGIYNALTQIVTLPTDTAYIRISVWGENKDVCQLEEGSTATPYEAYNGQTYTENLATTNYGGYWDVTKEEIGGTHANIASYNGETLPGAWISSMDEYTEGGTPTTGAQVVYELATPTTTSTTPRFIKANDGTTNLWADSGKIEKVGYYPTVQSLIDALSS